MKQQYRFYLKLFVILFLILFLLIPQTAVMSLIGERQSWRYDAYDSIRQSWPGTQTFTGPIITIPYQTTHWIKETVENKDGSTKEITSEVIENDTLQLIPKNLHITSQLTSSMRYRGIYEVPIYSNQLQVSGEFSNEALLELIANTTQNKLKLDDAQASLLVSDQRGITNPSAFKWGEAEFAIKPGSNLLSNRFGNATAGAVDAATAAAAVAVASADPNAALGVHVKLPISTFKKEAASVIPFQFSLELRGMTQMDFVPLAEQTDIKMQANWPHPKFIGQMLPENRTITDQGFTANWQASSFSYNVSAALGRCHTGNCDALLQNGVGFQLLQPVDVYQQSERSVKYGILFILLTFIALIMLELLKKLRIHPIQYILVGMALTVFYLLLISLSEHFDFFRAYVVATVASVGLLTLYFGAILRSQRLGLLLGAALAILYAVLYVILQAEDNALLMGSILIFAVLAGLMLATRHFDWYALTEGLAAPNLRKTNVNADTAETAVLSIPPETISTENSSAS